MNSTVSSCSKCRPSRLMPDMVRGCSTGTSISMLPIEYGPEEGGNVPCGNGRRSRNDFAGRDRGFFACGICPEGSPPIALLRRSLCGTLPVIRVVFRSRKDMLRVTSYMHGVVFQTRACTLSAKWLKGRYGETTKARRTVFVRLSGNARHAC